MNMKKVFEDRRSVREYKDKKVERAIIDDLFENLKNKRRLEEDIDIDYYFINDGTETYNRIDGLAGYFGKVIKAPHYICIIADEKEGYLESAGYLTERLVLMATKLGLGTCWIEISNYDDMIKESLEIKQEGMLIALLAIGYPKTEAKVLKMNDTTKKDSLLPLTDFGYPNMDIEFTEKPLSGRLSIEDIVYLKEWGKRATVDDLEDRGMAEVFYYMRLAPSWGNRQPWKFIIDGSKVVLAVKDDEDLASTKTSKIEAGIAMLYFELMVHEMGLPGEWHLEKLENDYKIPEDYFISGYYTI